MKEKIKILESVLGEVRIKTDEPLKYHLEIPSVGNAKVFYVATNLKELEQALNLAHELKIPFCILGGGTKIIIPDSGFEGFIIKNRTGGIKISGVKGKVSAKGIGVDEAMVEIESGVSFQKINEFLTVQKLSQLPFAVNPNSTIGGSLSGNDALSDITQKVKVWSSGQIFDIDVFDLKEGDCILSVIIKVKSGSTD